MNWAFGARMIKRWPHIISQAASCTPRVAELSVVDTVSPSGLLAMIRAWELFEVILRLSPTPASFPLFRRCRRHRLPTLQKVLQIFLINEPTGTRSAALGHVARL